MEDYVSSIGERSIRVLARASHNTHVILGLGGAPLGGDMWRIDCGDGKGLEQILQRLIDAKIAFEGGTHGWPPAETAKLLRDKGRLRGVIRRALWSGPDRQSLEDC